jgi:hypothetical protein
VVEHLLRAPGAVHLVADNYGRELAMDLVLIDHLLAGLGLPVVLHVKLHPTFVSDAIAPDVQRFLGLMAAHTPAARGLGTRLTAALESGRLRLAPDPYWNSPRPLWDLPPRLDRLFASARLVIFKGDLNYRRLVGDAIWPEGVSLADATRGFPAPLVALRSLKSESDRRPAPGCQPGSTLSIRPGASTASAACFKAHCERTGGQRKRLSDKRPSVKRVCAIKSCAEIKGRRKRDHALRRCAPFWTRQSTIVSRSSPMFAARHFFSSLLPPFLTPGRCRLDAFSGL